MMSPFEGDRVIPERPDLPGLPLLPFCRVPSRRYEDGGQSLSSTSMGKNIYSKNVPFDS